MTEKIKSHTDAGKIVDIILNDNGRVPPGPPALNSALQLLFELAKCFMNTNQIRSFITLSHMAKSSVTASMGDICSRG